MGSRLRDGQRSDQATETHTCGPRSRNVTLAVGGAALLSKTMRWPGALTSRAFGGFLPSSGAWPGCQSATLQRLQVVAASLQATQAESSHGPFQPGAMRFQPKSCKHGGWLPNSGPRRPPCNSVASGLPAGRSIHLPRLQHFVTGSVESIHLRLIIHSIQIILVAKLTLQW